MSILGETFLVEKKETNSLNRRFPKYVGNLLQRSMWWGHVADVYRGTRGAWWAGTACARRAAGGAPDFLLPCQLTDP